MNHRRLTLVFCGSLASVVAFSFACSKKARDEEPLTPGPGRDGTSPNANGGSPNQPRVESEAEVLDALLTSNEARITEGTMAQQKAVHPEVKSFASAMVSEYGKANDRLRVFIKEKKLAPEPSRVSERLRFESETTVNHVRDMSSGLFDRAYLSREVSMHNAMLDVIERDLSPTVKDADLKGLVDANRATIEKVLGQAQSLLEVVNPGNELPPLDAATRDVALPGDAAIPPDAATPPERPTEEPPAEEPPAEEQGNGGEED